MKCPKCQFENPTDTKFCVECGAKLEIAFPNCNASNSPDYKFCGTCGHNLTSPADNALPKDLLFDEKLAKSKKYIPDKRGIGEIVEKSPDLKGLLP